MITLTATIITYNEAQNIKQCIESVHEWCDEVIVLDSNSTDATKNIAQSFPKVKFISHAFDGHIQQKNRAIEMSAGRWIFSLDADERADPILAKSILEYINQHPNSNGARVKRLTWHLGRFIKHGGWYNARYRLIRKGYGKWTGENPHDYVLVDGVSRPTKGPILKGDLIHYSFQDLAHQVSTINTFSSIVAYTRFSKHKSSAIIKIILKPLEKFIEIYFFKLGLLDGLAGFVIAISSAYSTFLKFTKLYEMQKMGVKRPSNLNPDYKS